MTSFPTSTQTPRLFFYLREETRFRYPYFTLSYWKIEPTEKYYSMDYNRKGTKIKADEGSGDTKETILSQDPGFL